MQINFDVIGEPVGKGRPKFSTFNGRAVAYTPAKTVNYENLVRLSYQQQCREKSFEKDIPLRAVIYAYFPIPKSVSKKRRELMLQGEVLPTKKPDADNIIKSILDALNGIAFHDDSQVVEITLCKYYSEFPKVSVMLENVTR